ncbi:MAG: glutathione S-transferase family protein [Burkholderiales bacterium]
MSGYLENGLWHSGWYDTRRTGGAFERPRAKFRNRVTADGSSGFKAETGRYHLYVSLACPWAHRTLIFRKLKKLTGVISVDVVAPVVLDQGWAFGAGGDSVNGFAYLREAYLAADPNYSGRVTVPVLWDKQTGSIVNNESAEIIRMLNSAFDAFTKVRYDYYPTALRSRIDDVNDFVYKRVNNGVYRCGFAGSQQAYEEAFDALFGALDVLDRWLGKSRYLVGDCLTEADWRLFTTLVRFDAVYYVHFKCNLRRVAEYRNLSRLLRELYNAPGDADTVDFEHIKRHYYISHPHLNPSGIVPKGPELEFMRAKTPLTPTAPRARARR